MIEVFLELLTISTFKVLYNMLDCINLVRTHFGFGQRLSFLIRFDVTDKCDEAIDVIHLTRCVFFLQVLGEKVAFLQ